MDDWYRVLRSPSLTEKDWYKVRGPPLPESEIYKLGYFPPKLEHHVKYECVNCSRPVLKGYYGKEIVRGEFAAGAEEELLIFSTSLQVVVSTERVLFNGNMFTIASCECEAELGYYILELRGDYSKYSNFLYDRFMVKGERVKPQDTSRDMKMMEFVKDKARSVLSQMEKRQLPSGETIKVLTPEFMAAAGSAAVDVVDHVLNNDVEASLIPPFNQFLSDEPEQLSDLQSVIQHIEEPEEIKKQKFALLSLYLDRY